MALFCKHRYVEKLITEYQDDMLWLSAKGQWERGKDWTAVTVQCASCGKLRTYKVRGKPLLIAEDWHAVLAAPAARSLPG